MSLTQQGMHPATKEHLLKRIITALKDGTLELPTLPDIALKVRTAVNKENLSLEDLEFLVRQDPSLSAYLLKMSLSSHYKRRHSANSLSSALRRLGIDATRDLTSSHAIKTLFDHNDAKTKRLMRELWRRSTYTASLAHVMARYCGFDPGRALLAGLLQDIGALPLIASFKNYPNLIADADMDLLLDSYTGKISGIILNHWHFDHELVATGLERENWLRNKKGPTDLADLILIARYHSYLSEPKHFALPPLGSLPAFKKLNLAEAGPQQGLAFVHQAQEEISELHSALQ